MRVLIDFISTLIAYHLSDQLCFSSAFVSPASRHLNYAPGCVTYYCTNNDPLTGIGLHNTLKTASLNPTRNSQHFNMSLYTFEHNGFTFDPSTAPENSKFKTPSWVKRDPVTPTDPRTTNGFGDVSSYFCERRERS